MLQEVATPLKAGLPLLGPLPSLMAACTKKGAQLAGWLQAVNH